MMQTTVAHKGDTADLPRGDAKRTNKEAAGDATREVIKLSEIKKSVNELVVLYRRKSDAAAAYKDSIKAIAQKANCKKEVLNNYIKARADDKVKETHAAAEQLSLLFESL